MPSFWAERAFGKSLRREGEITLIQIQFDWRWSDDDKVKSSACVDMINRSRRVLVVDFGFGSGAGRKEGKEGRAVVVELYKKRELQ